jgi:ABC-type uncharacterized transport system permease subunit
MPLTLLSLLAIVLYLTGASLLAAPLTGCPRTPRRLGLTAASLAVLVHAAALLGAHGGRLDLHFFAALSLVACVVAAITLLVNLSRPVAGLGVIVFPLAALLLGLDTFLAPPTTPNPLDWQISLHVAIALLGYSVLSIAAVLAVLLAIQERALRTHRPIRLMRALPPLTQTESLLFRLIGAGFALLTLTLLSGLLFIQNIRAQHLIHTTVLSVVAWLIFGTLLWGRWRHGWRGRSAVNLCLAGMGVLLLAFFGSKAVLELILHRAG